MKSITRLALPLIILFICEAPLAIPIGPGETWEAPFDFSSQPLLLPVTHGGFSMFLTQEDSLDQGESFSVELLDADRESIIRFLWSGPLSGVGSIHILDTPLYEAPTGYLQLTSIGNSTFDPYILKVDFSGASVINPMSVLHDLKLVSVVSSPGSILLILIGLALLSRRASVSRVL